MGLVAKAFQDIITFSRASSGTYVNSNGYITNSSVLNYLTYSNQPENAAWTKSNSFVQQNLVTYSEDFTNAAWTAIAGNVTNSPNSTIAPDGTVTADLIYPTTTGTNRRIIRQLSLTSSVVYTQSIYIKSAGFQWVMIAAVNAASAADSCWFDIVNGVKGTIGSDAIATSITPVTGATGWFRITLTGTADAVNDYFIVTLADANGSSTATASGTNGVYIWGAQLVQGSVPGDYRATTSAALPCLYADYNGALRARKLCENTTNTVHAVLQTTATIIAGSQQTFSIYLRSGERTKGRMFCCNGAGSSGFQCDFDLVAGTATAGANVGTGAISGAPVISNLGGGNFRISLSGTIDSLSTTGGGYVYLRDAAGAASYTGDGSSGIYIADAQLNDGSSALAYYDTTASAYNAPRFDYDPVTLAAKGLLIEEQRANLLLQSNDFQTSWTPTNITRTLNSTLSPSGNVDGVKIAATAAAATQLLQAATVAATAATGSVYVKQGTGATVANQFTLRNNTTATNLIIGTLNYSTGVFTYSTGSTGVVVTNVGNGWWRIAMTATAGITSGDLISFYPGWSGNVATAGDFLYAYGAQLEAGAFATSYIPTTASQVTRAADVASVNTLSPWYNSVAGTLYTEFQTAPSAGAPQYFAELDDGTANNAIYNARDNSGNGISQIMTGGASQAALALSTLANVTVGKIAVAYAANDFAASKNGGAAVTDATGTVPTGLNILRLGANVSGGFNANFVNGHLRRITYYPRRLTNAELQTLTTL